MKPSPPRLHVIPASACDKALILRRGPSDQVATLLWDRKNDSFEMGQWLVGRIYEHRCDLSPDARHMVIFARKKDASLAWTALSRAPWLTALAYYPQESTWHGGGAFDAQGGFWLNGASAVGERLPDGLRAAPVDAFPHATDGFHMGGLYAAQMALRGWRHVSGDRYDLRMDKPIAGDWRLELSIQLQAKNRGLISNRYALVKQEKNRRIEMSDWEWAEPFADELHFAAGGALHRARIAEDGGLAGTIRIRDFSRMSFEALKAPYDGLPKQ